MVRHRHNGTVDNPNFSPTQVIHWTNGNPNAASTKTLSPKLGPKTIPLDGSNLLTLPPKHTPFSSFPDTDDYNFALHYHAPTAAMTTAVTPTVVCLPRSRLKNQPAVAVIREKLQRGPSICQVSVASPVDGLRESLHPSAALRKFEFVHFEDEAVAQVFVNTFVQELRCFVVDECSVASAQSLAWVDVAPGKRRVTLEVDHVERTPAALVGYALRGAGFVTRVAVCREEGRAYVDFLFDLVQGQRKKSTVELEKIRLEYKRASGADSRGRSGWRNGQGQRGSSGDKATTFRKWLVERYSAATLNSGSGVLDVAGGNGELAFKLLNFSEIQTTIVDPRPYSLLRMLKLVTKDHIYRLYHRYEKECENPRIRLPLPRHIRCWFTSPAVSQEQLEGSARTYANSAETLESLPLEKQVLQERLNTCSMIIGMHPDQATEPIVDNALQLYKPFAVVPCCVFPKLFPARSHVKTHEQFCSYLEAKAKMLLPSSTPYVVRRGSLDFNGRNTVVYLERSTDSASKHGSKAEDQVLLK